MDQGRGAAPVFVRRVGEKYLRRSMRFARSIEQTGGLAALRIGFRKVAEREQICRKEDAGERLGVPRRLRKAMIEAAPASTSDVSDDSVHHLAALLVCIEVLVEKMAKKAAALRDSDGVNAMSFGGGFRIVFQIEKKIADSREAQTGDDRVFCFINDFIDFAGLKAAVQMKKMNVRQEFSVDGVGKAPLSARDRLPPPSGGVTDRQDIFFTGGIIDGIALSARWPEEGMAERHVFHFLRGREIGTHQAVNFLSAGVVSDRSVELEVFAMISHVKFPAEPRNGVALAEEKSVAVFAVRTGRTIAVDDVQDSFSATIGNLEEYGVVSFVHVLGLQEIEVGGEFDFTFGVARRFVDVDYLAVVKIIRIYSEIDAPDNFLVGAGQSEGAAVLNVRTGNDFDAGDMRVRANAREEKNDHRENPSDARAQNIHEQPPKRAQLTSLLAETNSADADFIHRRAIEFQPYYAEFGGIEWPAVAFARRPKGRERSADGLEDRFPILVIGSFIHDAELCKLLLERRRDGDEAADRSTNAHSVGGHQFDGEIG